MHYMSSDKNQTTIFKKVPRPWWFLCPSVWGYFSCVCNCLHIRQNGSLHVVVIHGWTLLQSGGGGGGDPPPPPPPPPPRQSEHDQQTKSKFVMNNNGLMPKSHYSSEDKSWYQYFNNRVISDSLQLFDICIYVWKFVQTLSFGVSFPKKCFKIQVEGLTVL